MSGIQWNSKKFLCCSIGKKEKKKKIKLDNRHLIIIRCESINEKPKSD